MDNSGVLQGAMQGVQNPYGIAQGASAGANYAMNPGLQSAIQGATNAAGQIDYPRLQRQMGLTNEQMDSFIKGGGLSLYPGGQVQAGAQQGITGGANTGIGGGSGGWMDPNQMRAATNALQSSSGNRGGASLGGGGGQVGGSAPSSNGGLFSIGASPSSAPNLAPGIPASGGQPLTYQAPGYTDAAVPMSQGLLTSPNPQASINQYQQTPGYQMLGNDQTNQYQQSPGYQYAVNEALRQVQQNASARGLLESGSVMRGMTDRALGMANQDYGNWWNRQNQLYGDYQNRLAGLAGGSTGADQAYGLGQAQGTASLATGSNLGSLFGNLGNAGFGGITNTGAAQANNMNNAGSQQAQINAANQATRLAGAVQRSGLF